MRVVKQRGARCSIPEKIPGQVCQSSGEPDLADALTQCRVGVGLGDLGRSLPTLTIL